MAELSVIQPARAEPDLFFIQAQGAYIGNNVVWWQQGGGYTDNLDFAQRFTEEEICRLKLAEKHKPRRCKDVLPLTNRVVQPGPLLEWDMAQVIGEGKEDRG